MDATHLTLMENGEKTFLDLHGNFISTKVYASALNIVANRLNFRLTSEFRFGLSFEAIFDNSTNSWEKFILFPRAF